MRVPLKLPANTIRLRLTLLYGLLFLVSGAALLTITYVLVAHRFTGDFFISSGTSSGSTFIVRVGSAKPLLGLAPPGVSQTHIFDPSSGVFHANPAKLETPTPKQVAIQAHHQSTAALHQLLVQSAIALAIMAVIALWLGWVVAGRALRPLRTITNAVREISASSLHRRLALDGPDDELRRLGTTFDGLLGRLEASFEAQRRFAANASHELRTPLTLERTLVEVALADPDATVDSLRATCEQVLATGQRQERLIEALLTLSRGQRGLDRREPVDLRAAARDALAGVDGVAVETSLEPARTTGDPRLVERLVANLVANAASHNVPRGSIEVSTATRNGHALLTVSNTGPAVPADEVPRLLQPFQRLDGERKNGDGLGLGLSIVQAVADAHDARLDVTPRAGGGLRVEVAFPSYRAASIAAIANSSAR